jgi:hypothetical protein
MALKCLHCADTQFNAFIPKASFNIGVKILLK